VSHSWIIKFINWILILNVSLSSYAVSKIQQYCNLTCFRNLLFDVDLEVVVSSFRSEKLTVHMYIAQNKQWAEVSIVYCVKTRN